MTLNYAKGARPALIMLAMLALPACTTTMQSPTNSGVSKGMNCPCCAQMNDSVAGKDGCCCGGRQGLLLLWYGQRYEHLFTQKPIRIVAGGSYLPPALLTLS
jgi:hypothetical protein